MTFKRYSDWCVCVYTGVNVLYAIPPPQQMSCGNPAFCVELYINSQVCCGYILFHNNSCMIALSKMLQSTQVKITDHCSVWRCSYFLTTCMTSSWFIRCCSPILCGLYFTLVPCPKENIEWANANSHINCYSV